nr:T9SS type A sorting domain-containing protein [Saprospiraceae bacterium]
LITNVLDYIAGPPSGLNYEWVVPFEVTNDGTVYAGYKYIYRLDSSLNWQQVTNTVATTTAMEADPSNPNRVLYATRNNLGFFEIIKNGSTQIINTLTNPTNSLWINSISIDELHPKRIYALSYSDVYMSVDSGVTWTTITSNLAGNNLQAIAHEKNSMFNNVYVATSASIYFRNDTMSSWEPYNFGLPNTSVTDLEINATEGYIVASTYGRSIWRSPLPALNVGIGSIKEDKILLFPNPSSTYFKISIEINEPSTYQVYDMGGNLQLKKSFTSIDKNTMFDISNLHEGNYIIDIVSANHYIRRKIYRGH